MDCEWKEDVFEKERLKVQFDVQERLRIANGTSEWFWYGGLNASLSDGLGFFGDRESWGSKGRVAWLGET